MTLILKRCSARTTTAQQFSSGINCTRAPPLIIRFVFNNNFGDQLVLWVHLGRCCRVMFLTNNVDFWLFSSGSSFKSQTISKKWSSFNKLTTLCEFSPTVHFVERIASLSAFSHTCSNKKFFVQITNFDEKNVQHFVTFL